MQARRDCARGARSTHHSGGKARPPRSLQHGSPRPARGGATNKRVDKRRADKRMSAHAGGGRAQAGGGERAPQAPQPSHGELRALVEQQQREIAALREQVRALSASGNGGGGGGGGDDDDGAAFDAGPPRGAALRALRRGLATAEDVRRVARLGRALVGAAWPRLQQAFFREAERARDALPERELRREAALRRDWFKEPWYLMFAQDLGVEGGAEGGDFDSARRMLPYVRRLGFRNLCVLAHYESPMGDGGYDVSRYEVRRSLGGEAAFARFMDDAFALGMRVVTDAVVNHTSTEHEWFQRALRGEQRYINYYVQRNGREKVGEFDRDGVIVCRYRDADGTTSERDVAFPDVDRTHGLWAQIGGKTYQFYRSFYPFQVDLNLQNVQVLEELFAVLGRELCGGVLGKRMGAVPLWIKRGGGRAHGLPETHTLLALFKGFVKVVNGRAVLLAEVVGDSRAAARYSGTHTRWNGERCGSEGDLLWALEMQAGLRESTYLRTAAPFWGAALQAAELGGGAQWLNVLEQHDEAHLWLHAAGVRRCLGAYIASHGGLVFNNGRSAGGRVGDCLGRSAARVAAALAALYAARGTPMVYAGCEAVRRSDWAHARAAARRTRAQLGGAAARAAAAGAAVVDGRMLQRGPLRRDELLRGEAGAAARTLRRLNAARRRCAALRDGAVGGVDGGDGGGGAVLCVRRGAAAAAVLAVVNLSAEQRRVRVGVRQARAMWGAAAAAGRAGVALRDELGGARVFARRDGAWLWWTVAPFGAALLRLDDGDGGDDSEAGGERAHDGGDWEAGGERADGGGDWEAGGERAHDGDAGGERDASGGGGDSEEGDGC